MRETRITQASLFDNYSKHEYEMQLSRLSDILDENTEILSLIKNDLMSKPVKNIGRVGLSVENVFRCLLLKQQLGVSYEQLAFHLSDSMTYRTFSRLPSNLFPSRSGLQSTNRSIKPETLERIHVVLSEKWQKMAILVLKKFALIAPLSAVILHPQAIVSC